MIMLSSSSTADVGGSRRRNITLAILLVLVICSIILFNDETSNSYYYYSSINSKHQETHRRLSTNKNGADPPSSSDSVSGEYIIKPHVGYATQPLYETELETKLELFGATASSKKAESHLDVASNVLDSSPYTRWVSQKVNGGHTWDQDEWLMIDMGISQKLSKIFISFVSGTSGVDFHVDVSDDSYTWTTIETVTQFSGTGITFDEDNDWNLDPDEPEPRYVRVYLTSTNDDAYKITHVNIWRQPRIKSTANTNVFCGNDLESVKTKLLSDNGGSLIHAYELAEFFSATLTTSQFVSMKADPCAYAVEPNYIVRARGNVQDKQQGLRREEQRQLSIPEFNREDPLPASWGLERISSRGHKNGKYIWLSQGWDTHLYVFDTGIYPDHYDWIGRNVYNVTDEDNRLRGPTVCAGTTEDYDYTNHGTHLASIAAGAKYGVGKSTIIHSIQVLDANGEGTVASVLCGLEKLIQDGLDYNSENAPRKLRAVVNLSIGVNGRSDVLDKAVEDLIELGYVVVIAAGNNDGNACHYSPYHPSAITVGSLVDDSGDGANDKAPTSNYGECIDVWAPGEEIVGASNEGQYEQETMSGTSVAAAFTSGTATMFLEELLFEWGEFPSRTKEKLMKKAEMDVLGDLGHTSPNKMLQTTASRCESNLHCDNGNTCLEDGVCGKMSDYFKKKKVGNQKNW